MFSATTTPAASGWRVTGGYPSTQTPWYPRSSDQMLMDGAADMDMPNQQGLESAADISSLSKGLVTLLAVLVFLFSR